MNIVREMEYRANFAIIVLEGFAQLALALVTFAVLFHFTGSIAGWTQAQVLMVVGFYRVVDGIIAFQITPNMRAVPSYIEKGEFDYLLLRPVPNQYLTSIRLASLAELFNVFTGIALVGYATWTAHVSVSSLHVGEMLLLTLCGIALMYSLYLFAVTWCFWLVTDWLSDLFYRLFQTAVYPVSFFKGIIRAVLTVAVPVAFATTFPAQALLGTIDAWVLPSAIVLTIFALLVTHWLWNFAANHYSSASS